MSTEVTLGGEMFPENRAKRPRMNLEVESKKQSEALARRFAKQLGFSTEEYINALPKIGPRPREFEGILGIPAVPVIVESRFALPELLDIVSISSLFDPQKVEDWRDGGFETPSKPYVTWLTYVPNKSVQEVCASLRKGQRGGRPFDGIALYLRYPYLFNEHSFKFPGSRVGSEDAPFLSALPNSIRTQLPAHPSLHYGSIDSKSPKFACIIASC